MFLRGSFPSFCFIATISAAFGQEPTFQFPRNPESPIAAAQQEHVPFGWDAVPATFPSSTSKSATEIGWSRMEERKTSNRMSNFQAGDFWQKTSTVGQPPKPSAALTKPALRTTFEFSFQHIEPVSSHPTTAEFEFSFPKSTIQQVEPQEKSISPLQLASVDEEENGNNSKVEQVQARPSQAKADTASLLKGAFKTESYTAPLVPSQQLFAGLKISDAYQTAGGIQLEEPRVDSLATPFTWASPVFAHRPLYFEQPNLERYGMGHRKCAQPLFSGLHFYGSVFLLPYKMITQHPHEESYTLGHQRPGNRVCYQRRALLGL